ncbi:hypothetical protein [Roseovarius sp. D22-M7]|uniref:hypothetical protein n=1 Tax=Roseovarius sp. D22-M7 TaxID=3127116 RepID=UPI00300FEBE6
MRTPFCLSLTLFFSVVAPPILAQDDLGELPRKTLPMDDADTVRIGLPYDTAVGSLGGAQPCLAGYEATIDADDPNRFEQRMVQSTNAMEVARALNIDATANGIVGGAQVSGKLGFAANTSVAHNALNYTLYARYQAPPQRIAPQDGAVLRLAPFAQDLIDRSDADFRDTCGDSFVEVIFRGAEAYGTLSFFTVDASERRKIDAAVDAKGIGWSASAAMKDEIDTHSSSGTLSVTYSQTGGLTGDKTGSAEDQWARLEQAIEGIKGTSSPVKTGYRVVSYAALPGWSHGALTPSPDILNLVYRLSAFETLNRALVPMIADPWQTELDFVMRRAQGDGAGSIAALTRLQTDLLAARATVAAILAACRDWTPDAPPADCKSQDVLNDTLEKLPDPYTFMARMPLRVVSREDFHLDREALVERIFQQNLMFARNAYCEEATMQNLTHPACIDQATLRDRYMSAILTMVTPRQPPAVNKRYQIVSNARTDNTCVTAYRRGTAKTTQFMQTCNNRRDIFLWQSDGKIKVRDGECIAGPIKRGAATSTHPCSTKEGVQTWRFIPTPGADGAHGLISEAGQGRCLLRGPEKSGSITPVLTDTCDPSRVTMQWRLVAK